MEAKIFKMLDKSKPQIQETSTQCSSSYKQSTKFLDVDARGDRIYLSIEEINESGRRHNVSMTIPRNLWNEYRKLIKDFDGSEI